MADERAPKLTRAALAWQETYYYCVIGGPFTFAVVLCLLVLASPAVVVWGWSGCVHAGSRMASFALILFACGLPANLAFTMLVRGRVYVPGDPLVDWLPWLPSTHWIVGTRVGGRYLGHGSPWILRSYWLALAVPTWWLAVRIYQGVF